MQQALIDFYKSEYESTPNLTLAGLANKYNINIADLGDISHWKKEDFLQDKRPLSTQTTQVISVNATQQELLTDTKDNIKERLLDDDIGEYKRTLIKEALYRLKTELKSMSIKDLKELTTIVDMVDKSNQKVAQGQQVNVLVQNIVKTFKDDV